MMHFYDFNTVNFIQGNMLQHGFGGFIGIILVLASFDIALRGWGMWRAARMEKNIWFIVLLFINSLGILPAIFLIITNDEYLTLQKKKGKGSIGS